jgi:hypothetical protein
MQTVSAPTSTLSLLLRRFRAAVVLAAAYTVGVGTCLLMFLLLVHDRTLYVDSLRSTASSFGVLFAAAFIVLAFARRVGFVVLWALLTALWTLLITSGGGYEFPLRFLQWTVMAAPLYLIGLGAFAAGRIQLGKRVLSPLFLCGVAWIALVIAGFLLQNYAYPPQYARIVEDQWNRFVWVNRLGWSLWAPAPFILAIVSVYTFWRGSRDIPSVAA